ncbi:DNA ligase [Vibrio salinus]|uniref:DNA ligase n=1 Tax=Vibrio salinus TaxID=2899784 RepID=UPI001E28870E|nr:DNA ligase [Vibrio salinus]MCE0493821.1 DNA ligase [Vibrio salinus]
MHYGSINKEIIFLPLFSLSLTCPASETITQPSLTLATEYQSGIPLSHYWISEKYDGIRALWTGTKLVTRCGNLIHAPKWFTAALPKHIMIEGELWAGRNGFNHVQNTVLDSLPDDKAWHDITWMVFDMPLEPGDYVSRYAALKLWVNTLKSPFLDIVSYQKIPQEAELMEHLNLIEKKGGEGIILRRINDRYQGGRSDGLIKLKSYRDAEATVIGYKPGKGRLQGKTGALIVQTDTGIIFSLGSGLSDNERNEPPQIRSRVTYRYNGFTAKGKPRFARFLRVRHEGL